MSVRVGVYQFAPQFGQVHHNLTKVACALQQCRPDLLVLPELFNCGYQFTSTDEVERLAESVPDGETTRQLESLAAGASMYIVGGVAEREEDRFYNSAVLIGPQGFIGKYQKTHLFFQETLWFSPGRTGFSVFPCPGSWGEARVGLMVCYDWLFPEAARTLALRGADIIAHPACLVLPHCPEAMITRSLENRVFSITADRVGTERRAPGQELQYIGQSQVVSPRGEMLFRLDDEECLRTIDIDPGESRDKSITPYNDILADRRPGFYMHGSPGAGGDEHGGQEEGQS